MTITSESVFKRLFYEICEKHECFGLKDIEANMKKISSLIKNLFPESNVNDISVSGDWQLALKIPGSENNFCPIDSFTNLSKDKNKIILDDFDNDWDGYKLVLKIDKELKGHNNTDTYNLQVDNNNKYILKQDTNGFNVEKVDKMYSFNVKDYFKTNIKEISQ
jgi:hypothetical protein